MATPRTGTLAAGTHRATVEVASLAQGVYVVRALVNIGHADGDGPARRRAVVHRRLYRLGITCVGQGAGWVRPGDVVEQNTGNRHLLLAVPTRLTPRTVNVRLRFDF